MPLERFSEPLHARLGEMPCKEDFYRRLAFISDPRSEHRQAPICLTGGKDRMRMFESLLSTVLFFLLSSVVYAGETVVLNLDECIERALKLSPEIAEASYEIKSSEAKRIQVEGGYYPQIEVVTIIAPSPRARGDQVSSPDDSTEPVISGIFGRSEITFIQPLYTFNRLGSLKKATTNGIRVAEAGRDKTVSDVVLRTKQLYYTIHLAKALRGHILDIKETILDALEKVDKRIEKGLPTADVVDRYKLMTFLGVIEARLNEVEKNLSIAKEALKTSVGIDKDTGFDIADEPFVPIAASPISIEDGMRLAAEGRPEFIQLREGINARKALVDAEKSNYYPFFFFGLKGSVASASNRDRLHNPFIIDEFNHSYVSVFLGFKWSMDFGITKGRVVEAESELKKLLEKKRFADEAIPLEIKKIYMEIKEARQNIEALESAYKNAKRWLVAALSNLDMGIGETRDVADAIEMYAITRADYLKALYDERLAYANLYHAIGMDLAERGYRKR